MSTTHTHSRYIYISFIFYYEMHTVAPACVWKKPQDVFRQREFRSTTQFHHKNTKWLGNFLFSKRKLQRVFNHARKMWRENNTHTHTLEHKIILTGSVTMRRLGNDTPWCRLNIEYIFLQRRLEIGSSSPWMFDTWGRGGETMTVIFRVGIISYPIQKYVVHIVCRRHGRRNEWNIP
jgi:hypothetical protein